MGNELDAEGLQSGHAALYLLLLLLLAVGRLATFIEQSSRSAPERCQMRCHLKANGQHANPILVTCPECK